MLVWPEVRAARAAPSFARLRLFYKPGTTRFRAWPKTTAAGAHRLIGRQVRRVFSITSRAYYVAGDVHYLFCGGSQHGRLNGQVMTMRKIRIALLGILLASAAAFAQGRGSSHGGGGYGGHSSGGGSSFSHGGGGYGSHASGGGYGHSFNSGRGSYGGHAYGGGYGHGYGGRGYYGRGYYGRGYYGGRYWGGPVFGLGFGYVPPASVCHNAYGYPVPCYVPPYGPYAYAPY
jgi:hypothetical protein